MVPTVNSFNIAQLLPIAQLIICRNSGHGYPALFGPAFSTLIELRIERV
jgi:hypothetical protein